MIDHKAIIKNFKTKFTWQAITFFVVGNIVLLICLGCKVSPPINFDNTSITNFFFALATITAIGFSLSFSTYEIDELKEYREKIRVQNDLPNDLKDTIEAKINLKIRDAKPVNISSAKFYLFMTVFSAAAIIINEFLSSCQPDTSLKISFILKSEGLIVLFVIVWHLFCIYKYKESLVELTVSEYDKKIKQIIEIQAGDYKSLLS